MNSKKLTSRWICTALSLYISQVTLANAGEAGSKCEATLRSAREACLDIIAQTAVTAKDVLKIEKGVALPASILSQVAVTELNGIVSPKGRRIDSVFRVLFSSSQSYYAVEVRLAYGDFEKCRTRVMQVQPYWPDGPGGAPSGD